MYEKIHGIVPALTTSFRPSDKTVGGNGLT
jgi:hypothetical protein